MGKISVSAGIMIALMALVWMAFAFSTETVTVSPALSNEIAGPDTVAKSIEAQIRQVENSLAGAAKFEGSSGSNMLDRMAIHNVKGLSLAVVKDYEVIWAKGYGWADQGQKHPVTDQTMFMAASVSKSVNSLGVMKLVQDQKLDLARDINDYLVSWKYPYDRVSNGKKINTLNLLTHTSGVNNGAPSYIALDSIPSIVEVLNGAPASQYVYSDPERARSVMEPGRQYEYSNTGIGITQVIVSDITHKTYPDYMQEAVFGPLGMTNSCYTEASLKARAGQVATGYTMGYEVPSKHVIIPLQAAGGLWTTPSDLARMIIEVQLAYLGKPSKLLTHESAKTMLTPYFHAAPGFFVTEMKSGGQKYFTHSGVIKGFQSEYFGSLDGGNGVVVMINSDGKSGNIIREVINSVATVYKWKDFYEPQMVKKPIAVSDALLARCEGVYLARNEYIVVTQRSEGGHSWDGSQECCMHFRSRHSFFDLESQTMHELAFNAAGDVTGIKRMWNGRELTAFTAVKDVASAPFSQQQLIEISWYLLEHKKFGLAQTYFEQLLALDPQDLMAECNLAHCYLFGNQYDKALELYKRNLDTYIDDHRTCKQIMLNDFVFFQGNGFDTRLMESILADLGLERPKTFQN